MRLGGVPSVGVVQSGVIRLTQSQKSQYSIAEILVHDHSDFLITEVGEGNMK